MYTVHSCRERKWNLTYKDPYHAVTLVQKSTLRNLISRFLLLIERLSVQFEIGLKRQPSIFFTPDFFPSNICPWATELFQHPSAFSLMTLNSPRFWHSAAAQKMSWGNPYFLSFCPKGLRLYSTYLLGIGLIIPLNSPCPCYTSSCMSILQVHAIFPFREFFWSANPQSFW